MSHYDWHNVPFESIVGKTVAKVSGLKKHSDQVDFTTTDGVEYTMFHERDCCEVVWLEDVPEDAEELLTNATVLRAEVAVNPPESPNGPDDGDSHTYTFYRLQTTKGPLVLRWHGQSNGYYSESVSFKANREPEEKAISTDV